MEANHDTNTACQYCSYIVEAGAYEGKERPSAYLMCSAKFISYARPYMEWPAAGHFHWLSSDHTQLR